MVGKTAPGIRLGTLLVTIALAVSSCNGDDAAAETTVATTIPTTTTTAPTTAPPTTAAPTTTTAAPPTTADPLARPEVLVSNFDRESVDDFDTTGDNLWAVMLEIEDLFNYLEGTPSGSGEEMLGMMYGQSYPDREMLLKGFDELAQNDWRYVDAGTETVAIDVDELAADEATVRVATRRGDQRIADAEGNVVKVYRGWDLDVLTYVLQRQTDGRWLIADFVGRLHPVPDTILAAMVPIEWTGRS